MVRQGCRRIHKLSHKSARLRSRIRARSSRPAPCPREFVDGAGFPYLGRSYRLLLVQEQEVPVKLTGGRFQMRRAHAAEGEAHLIRWYSAHARE